MNIQQETNLVKDVIKNYIDGTYNADITKLESVFHKMQL